METAALIAHLFSGVARLPPGDSSLGRSGQDEQGLFYRRQMILNVTQSCFSTTSLVSLLPVSVTPVSVVVWIRIDHIS